MNVVKITVQFEAGESKWFRMYSGAFVRGFVYWVIGKSNRIFAEELHSSRELAPFSATPVTKDGVPVEKLEEGESYEFSVCFFVPEIGEALKNYLTAVDRLYFAGCENRLSKVRVRYCSRFRSEPVRKFSVRFVSPCYFRVPSNNGKYRFLPLPLPELMFRSLARLYSAFIEELPLEYREWLDSGGVAVSGHEIRTKKVLLKKGIWSVGFTGWVNFSIPSDTYDEEFAKITSALLDFGEYSNVGGGRTSGLGVIRKNSRR